jgi:hypothetical protein
VKDPHLGGRHPHHAEPQSQGAEMNPKRTSRAPRARILSAFVFAALAAACTITMAPEPDPAVGANTAGTPGAGGGPDTTDDADDPPASAGQNSAGGAPPSPPSDGGAASGGDPAGGGSPGATPNPDDGDGGVVACLEPDAWRGRGFESSTETPLRDCVRGCTGTTLVDKTTIQVATASRDEGFLRLQSGFDRVGLHVAGLFGIGQTTAATQAFTTSLHSAMFSLELLHVQSTERLLNEHADFVLDPLSADFQIGCGDEVINETWKGGSVSLVLEIETRSEAQAQLAEHEIGGFLQYASVSLSASSAEGTAQIAGLEHERLAFRLSAHGGDSLAIVNQLSSAISLPVALDECTVGTCLFPVVDAVLAYFREGTATDSLRAAPTVMAYTTETWKRWGLPPSPPVPDELALARRKLIELIAANTACAERARTLASDARTTPEMQHELWSLRDACINNWELLLDLVHPKCFESLDAATPADIPDCERAIAADGLAAIGYQVIPDGAFHQAEARIGAFEQIRFVHRLWTVGEPECRGLPEERVPFDQWSSPVTFENRINNAYCGVSWSVQSPANLLLEAPIALDWSGDTDQNECLHTGTRSVPATPDGEAQSDPHYVNPDNGPGGCKLGIFVNDPALRFLVEVTGSELACGPNGIHVATSDEPVQLRLNSKTLGQGCQHRYMLTVR